MTGLWRCARYAFSPNKLKYCGPDKNQELKGYLATKTSDLGLSAILSEFNAMYPYLKLIAHENGIADPFDGRVVEAYWLGNRLLEAVSLKSFFNHARQRLAKKDLKWFELKMPLGARPNHQFHVLNFMKRVGHKAISHTVETMDSCRIAAGMIVRPGKVKTDKLVYKNSRLVLEPAVKATKNITNEFRPGDLVTLHWGWVCEKINQRQLKNLRNYTALALKLGNTTL